MGYEIVSKDRGILSAEEHSGNPSNIPKGRLSGAERKKRTLKRSQRLRTKKKEVGAVKRYRYFTSGYFLTVLLNSTNNNSHVLGVPLVL